MRLVKSIGAIFLLFISFTGTSQNIIPLLDRKVSVNFSGTPLKEALFSLSEKGKFNLSFNANILQSESLVSFTCEEKKLLEVFSTIIPEDFDIKTTGNNVILLKKAEKDLKKKEIVVQGKVFEISSGKPVEKVTILDVYGAQSVLTDTSGIFKIQLTHKQPDLIFSVSKLDYKDTTFLLKPESQNVIFHLQHNESIIELTPVEISPIRPVEAYSLSKLLLPKLLVTHSENITGYTKRKFQFSITPGTSTNLKIAGTVKNDFSINLIGGYNYGIEIFEVGGAFNINRTNVNGFQIAGITNLVGGDVRGLQMSGIANRTKGRQFGMQASGFANFNANDFSGFQLSSAANIARNVVGVQLAAGINSADTLSGFQLTVAHNKVSYLKGVQISSGLNASDTSNGVQIGIVNRAKQQNGFQLGIVNINDSSKGLSIGIINFVKDKRFPRPLFAYK